MAVVGVCQGKNQAKVPLGTVDLNGLKAEAQKPCRTLVCNSRRIDGA